jgi:hypothetical protein
VKQDEIKAKLTALDESFRRQDDELRQKRVLIANKSRE